MAGSDSAFSSPRLDLRWRVEAREVAVERDRRRRAPARRPPSESSRVHNPDCRWNVEPLPGLALVEPLAPPPATAPCCLEKMPGAPPWLVSLSLHLFAMLTLSLWIIPDQQARSPQVLTLSPVDRSEPSALELLAAVQLEMHEPPTGQPAGALLPGGAAASVEPFEPAVHLDTSLLGQNATAVESSVAEALAAAGGGAIEASANGLPVAEFFGVQARGTTFVFVVDNSKSMRLGKLDTAKEELLYSIRRLSSDQSFYVFFFHGETVPMALEDPEVPEPAPLAATNENIGRLEAWVDTVEVDPWTNPHDALRQAIAMAPDAIFLLSDGRFTDRGETIRFLKKDNFVRDEQGRRRPKVVIHTVGLHQRDGEATLKSIARNYGGTYRFVPPPK